MARVAGWAAPLLSVLAISGCACGSFLDSGSTGCDTQIVGAAILAAPVAVPSALISNGMDTLGKKARLAKNWQLLQAEDPTTVTSCVIGCRLPSVSTDDEKQQREARQHGIDLVIAWWGKDPQKPVQIAILTIAYFKKGAWLMKSDPAQADFFLRQAAAWSTDPRIERGLRSREFSDLGGGSYPYNLGDYDRQVIKPMQEKLMILRYRGIPGHQSDPDILKNRCQAIAAWPPTGEKIPIRNL